MQLVDRGYGATSKVTVTWTTQPALGGQQPIIGGCVAEIERMAPSFLPPAVASASAVVPAFAPAAAVTCASSAAGGCGGALGAPPLPAFPFHLFAPVAVAQFLAAPS